MIYCYKAHKQYLKEAGTLLKSLDRQKREDHRETDLQKLNGLWNRYNNYIEKNI